MDVKFHPEMPFIFSSSADANAIVWKYNDSESKRKINWNLSSFHSRAIVSISMHPSSYFYVTASKDGTVGFRSLLNQKTLSD